MTALTAPTDELDVPSPVLLNVYKHHAGALKRHIAAAVAAGRPGLAELAERLVVIGTELMDLYTGDVSPAGVASRLLAELRAEGRLALPDYRDWVRQGGGYAVLPLADDGSRWVFRLGDEAGRYVHVHPARYAPQTQRVRANVLKTAVLALAAAAVEGGGPLDRGLVNAVRQRYLGLAPVGRDLAGDQGGIGEVIALLSGPD
jgi:hypothetical protein